MADQSWVAQFAEREKKRREEYRVLRAAAVELQEELQNQIMADLEEYSRVFPDERAYLSIDDSGITREREADARLSHGARRRHGCRRQA